MCPSAPSPFVLGVNYPWVNYAQDFGVASAGHSGLSLPEPQEIVARDFAEIRETGASAVRWFLFGDGRAGFLTEKGIPARPDSFLFKDVSAVLELARRFDLKLCLSLMDYLWLQDHGEKREGHANQRVLQFAAGREALLDRVLIPMFREFQAHPALFAWEIANEPEWAIREFHRNPVARMRYADFRVFAREIALAVREYAKAPVTLGSARLMWVRAWMELGLDFYQAHYYPAAEGEAKSSLAQSLLPLRSLDQPLWLGELPAHDVSGSGYSVENALDLCRSAGLYGAAVWRWTKPAAAGTDAGAGQIEPAVLRSWTSLKSSAAQTA